MTLSFSHLVHDVLNVDWLEDLGLHYSMQVCVHELEYQINIHIIACLDHVKELNDIVVTGKFLWETKMHN